MNIAAGGLQKNVWREGEISMTTWTQMREELTINELEELLIEREKTIIRDMVRIRASDRKRKDDHQGYGSNPRGAGSFTGSARPSL